MYNLCLVFLFVCLFTLVCPKGPGGLPGPPGPVGRLGYKVRSGESNCKPLSVKLFSCQGASGPPGPPGDRGSGVRLFITSFTVGATFLSISVCRVHLERMDHLACLVDMEPMCLV